jgi:SAM-dependent methyltransferase
MAPAHGDASAKWLATGSGEHYESTRFHSARARERDGACVIDLLERVCASEQIARALDVPCGSGRLSSLLAQRAGCYLGVDVSRAMLQAAQPALGELGPRALAVEADAFVLPLASGAFDLVVACRWLHHLHREESLRRAIEELARVSRGVVIASFWDEHSLPGWRRRLELKRDEGPNGRCATSRARIAELFDRAGADVVAWRSSLRFVAQQTFVAARVRRART